MYRRNQRENTGTAFERFIDMNSMNENSKLNCQYSENFRNDKMDFIVAANNFDFTFLYYYHYVLKYARLLSCSIRSFVHLKYLIVYFDQCEAMLIRR